MSPLPILMVIGTLAGAAALAVALDFVKVPAFRRLAISELGVRDDPNLEVIPN